MPTTNALSIIDNNKDIDTTDLDPPWGPVIFTKCNADYEGYYSDEYPCLSMIVGEYAVLAIGCHYIRWRIDYTIVIDGIHHNKTYQGYDAIYTIINPITFWYTWMMGGKPIKWMAKNKITFPFEGSMERGGMWTFSLYVDNMDTPVKSDTYQLI